jgi:ribonucleoside-diphosphate reductase beta chain
MTKVFERNDKDHLKRKMFLDGAVDIQRYDTVKYKQFEKLTERQLGYFWLPQEVDTIKDAKEFKELQPHEQHIFTSNLKRQILLDSVQGRSPNLAFLPIVSLPELETWIETWAFSETIHSRSYTHIIRTIYPNPSKVFDELLDIPQILDCADSITANYDSLIEYNHLLFRKAARYDEYEHKKRIWKALMSVNILEGVRFYVSFACSWAFGELKRMEGNAKIIKLIARDENVHLASTQQILKLLIQEDKDFAKIAKETAAESAQMYVDAVNQEKDWADYLFKDGSIIGLNAELLKNYIEWIAAKRMTSIGLDKVYTVGSNPLPWTQRWIGGSDVQVAPQETEQTSYVTGGTKQDLDDNTFKGMSL